MDPVRVLELDGEVDLRVFSAYLWQSGVPHRVFEERGKLVLEVARPGDGERVRQDFAAWRHGALALVERPRGDAPNGAAPQLGLASLLPLLKAHPVLTVILGIALVVYVAYNLLPGHQNTILGAMIIVNPRLAAPPGSLALLLATLQDGQIWRLLTPVFLHFSSTHLMFNLVAVAEFGRRIERGHGSVALLVVAVLIGVISNVGQLAWYGAANFGGLSGIAYGLFGFVAVRSFQAPQDPVWRLHSAFTVMIIAMLVIMSTGITEYFGLYIAHAAHWVGLAMGVLLAVARPPRRGTRAALSADDT